MSRLTMHQRLFKRELHKPSPILYGILMLVNRILYKKANTHFTYKAKPAEDPSNIVLISNHASRNDYMFTAPAVLPKRLNYVVGYNEFFRFPLGLLLRWMQVVPKRNFTPDVYTISQIMRLAKKGANICFMPEGMSSITGMAQPVMPGGGKLLKRLGLPVYYTKISGGYLTYTKHCLDERIGRIEVVVDRMFTAEDLKRLTPEEIEDTMNRLLAHDDYIWNKNEQHSFKVKGGMANKLDTLLYLCPKCGAMYAWETSGDEMRCKACGNLVALDSRYNLRPVGEGSECPELVTDWTILERERAAEDVRKPGFSISEHVKIGKLKEYGYLSGDKTSIICGEGELLLDETGLHFNGVKDGEPFCFHMTPEQVPTYGMCTDISRFYTFVDGMFIEFYPDSNDVLRWDHLTEEMHRYKGGKWQNTSYRHYE